MWVIFLLQIQLSQWEMSEECGSYKRLIHIPRNAASKQFLTTEIERLENKHTFNRLADV